MPAWLLPPQILLLAAPIAMLFAALALSAGERRAKAKRVREALGAPLGDVEEAAIGERVVVVGKLHVLESACARFEDGREAAATTVESKPAPALPVSRMRSDIAPARFACSARAGAMVLSCGKEDVLIEGPVEVAVGTDEMAPAAPYASLAAKVRERVEAAAGGIAGLAGESMEPPTFRSVRDGARVLATGRLAKRSDGARAGYRERAKWALVGSEEAKVVLACEGTPRHRGTMGALLSGVRRVELGHAAMGLAVAAAMVAGRACTIEMQRHRPITVATNVAGVELGGARASTEDMRWTAASCAEPRPVAIPVGWRCIGETESFSMYLPGDVRCVEERGSGCAPQGYASSGMRIHPRYDAAEAALATLEHHGTEVEIDGVPARVQRSRGAIKLVFAEEGTGLSPHFDPIVLGGRLAFDVECRTDEACRDAWLALQTIRLR